MRLYSKLSDQELTVLLKQGDRIAFEEVYDRYKRILYIHGIRMLDDPEEVNDLLQEIFTTLWIKAPVITFHKSLSAYLYTSVKNKILTLLTRKKLEVSYLESLQKILDTGDNITDERIRENELIAIIEKEIENLPAKMREIFELSRKENLSHKEIAAKLSISDKTVKKQVNNALKILRLKINVLIFFSTIF